MAKFYTTVDSETEADFDLDLRHLRENNSTLADYLVKHWWKYKTKIVKCWTDQYKHFRYRDTSAVEGTDAQCKRWLINCNGDLFTVFNSLLPWSESAASSVRERSSRDATILPFALQKDRYSEIARVISVYAITATDKLWKEALGMISGHVEWRMCTGVFRTVNDRPCVHELMDIIQ
eukprot:jgi/Phyca11/117955/e_gw1.34.351.1